MRTHPLAFLFIASLLAPAAAAQVLPHARTFDVVVCDGDGLVVRLADLNQDGTISGTSGYTALFDPLVAGAPALPLPNSIAFDAGGHAYVGDTSADVVMRLIDRNGDGDANDAGEWSVWIDNTNASGFTFASALAIRADATGGIVGVNSGAGANPLDFVWRAQDSNGDGDANDAGEIAIVYDSVAGAFNIAVPWGIAVEPATNDLIVADVNPDVIYRLHDANLDGDFYDAGEITIAYNSPVGSPAIKNVAAIAYGPDGAAFFDDTSSDFILRAVDLDQNGDWNGAGEVTIFADKTGNTLGVPANHFNIEVDELGRVWACENSTAVGQWVVRYADGNGDGDAQDAGEVVKVYDGTSGAGPGTVGSMRALALVPAPRLETPTSVVVTPGNLVLFVHGAEGDAYQLLLGLQPLGFAANVPPFGFISYVPLATLFVGTIPTGGVETFVLPIASPLPIPAAVTFSAAVGKAPYRTYLSTEQTILFQ